MNHVQLPIQFLITAFITGLFTPLFSQVTSSGWVTTIAGVDYQVPFDLKTDQHGNIYTIGTFSGLTDFDGSASTQNVNAGSDQDVFLTKHRPDGELQWVATFGGSSTDIGFGLDIDDSGNVYAVGSEGEEDAFILKLDSSGVVQWVNRIGGSSVDEAKDVAVDHDGNIYVVGNFVGSVDLDPTSGTANFQATGGGPDGFIIKLTSEGEFLWAFDIGSSGNDHAEAVVVDGTNNVIIAGNFSAGPDFDPGPDMHTVSAGSGSGDPFYLKLTPSGSFEWVTTFESTGYVYAGDVDVDRHNNIVTHGFFTKNINPDPGNTATVIQSVHSEDSYTAKINSNGDVAWLNTISGSSLQFGFGVAVDPIDDVYATGYFWDTTDFDPGANELLMTTYGGEEAYIVKYNSTDGQLAWVKRTGGLGGDSGYGIDINATGDILVAGSFWSDADLDPEPEGTLMVENKGSADVSILHIEQLITSINNEYAVPVDWKLFPNPSSGEVTISGIDQYPIRVSIMDLTGNKLYGPQLLTSEDVSLNVHQMPAGVYYIEIQSAQSSGAVKWIKI
jgi:hypothetical protein